MTKKKYSVLKKKRYLFQLQNFLFLVMIYQTQYCNSNGKNCPDEHQKFYVKGYISGFFLDHWTFGFRTSIEKWVVSDWGHGLFRIMIYLVCHNACWWVLRTDFCESWNWVIFANVTNIWHTYFFKMVRNGFWIQNRKVVLKFAFL